MHTIAHPDQIGALLVARRKRLKLSQTQVADKIALSQNRLSELESAPATLTAAQLLKLLDVLGFDLHIVERTRERPESRG
jgi:HTH-type transcriptional regulator/antitoxin HipB